MGLFHSKARILLVCTENICRSPMAEGLMRHHLQQTGLAKHMEVHSAGTRASQPGCPPDQRAQKVAALRGINLSRIRARRVTERDLIRSEFVFAMDHSNVRDLGEICPAGCHDKISLLLSHQRGQPLIDVPDPYFGSIEAFERVFQLLEAAMSDLLMYIESSLP